VKEIGCVVSVKDDAAVVAMPMSGACEKCGMCMMSGDGREVMLLAKNQAGAGDGDTVEIEISAGRVVASAFLIYMVPVVMTIVGFLIGNAFTRGAEDSVLPIVMAIVFLVGSFIVVGLYDLRLRRSERREATVIRVLTEEEAAEYKRQVQPVNYED
jgi:sigma-E factor negative regulatory protein RseC